MKKSVILLLLMAVTMMAAAAGNPKIEFETTTHDFGNIKASGGMVKCEYPFTNTGDAPLLILTVTNGGCGCTTPSFPKEPIAPGASGKIVIHFDPKGRRGELNRTVMVSTNTAKKRLKLQFSGVVVP